MTGLPDRNRPEGCLSDLALDRLIVGELAGKPDLRAVEAHLAGCPSCQRRRVQLETEPAPVTALWTRETLEERQPVPTPGVPASRRRRWAGISGLALAAAAAVALVVRARAPVPAGALPSPGIGTQVKGAPFSLQAMVRRADTASVEPVLPNSRLHEGDAVRFRVRTPAAGYLVVLGFDARGEVSTYAPPSGTSIPIAVVGEHELEGSVVLDGALGPEEVVAVLCSTPDGVSRIAEAARAAPARGGAKAVAANRLALDCMQAHVSYLKTLR